MLVGNIRKLFNIHHIARRVADRFTKQQFGFVIYQCLHTGIVIIGHKAGFHSLPRQGMGKQIIGAAIELTGADYVVTTLGNGLHSIGDRRHTGSNAERPDTPSISVTRASSMAVVGFIMRV